MDQTYHFPDLPVPSAAIMQASLKARIADLKNKDASKVLKATDKVALGILSELDLIVDDLDRHIAAETRKNLEKKEDQ